jgi:hypothetical protein
VEDTPGWGWEDPTTVVDTGVGVGYLRVGVGYQVHWRGEQIWQALPWSECRSTAGGLIPAAGSKWISSRPAPSTVASRGLGPDRHRSHTPLQRMPFNLELQHQGFRTVQVETRVQDAWMTLRATVARP